MKRRSFLSMLGAAAAAPVLPVPALGSAASTAAGYNRYMYGYAVFRARHGGTFGVADLAASVKVTTAQAQAMLSEMTSTGVVRKAAGGAFEALTTHGGAGKTHWLRNIGQTVEDLLEKMPEAPDAQNEDTEVAFSETEESQPFDETSEQKTQG